MSVTAIGDAVRHLQTLPAEDMSPSCRLIWLLIANRVNTDTGECFPSIGLLVAESGMHRSNVIRHLNRQCALGLIERRVRPGHSTVYLWKLDPTRRTDATPPEDTRRTDATPTRRMDATPPVAPVRPITVNEPSGEPSVSQSEPPPPEERGDPDQNLTDLTDEDLDEEKIRAKDRADWVAKFVAEIGPDAPTLTGDLSWIPDTALAMYPETCARFILRDSNRAKATNFPGLIRDKLRDFTTPQLVVVPAPRAPRRPDGADTPRGRYTHVYAPIAGDAVPECAICGRIHDLEKAVAS